MTNELPHRVLAEGFAGIVESPRWHDGRLWFCNWGPNTLLAVDLAGNVEVILDDPAVAPHSIAFLPDGTLLVAPKESTPENRLLRREPDGSFVPYCDLTHLAHGFNELLVDGRGNIYVNGADFEFLKFIERASKDMAAGDTTPLHERPDFVPGAIILITPDGSAREVAGDIAFPNGMVVTPDNRTLVISESFTGTLTAFDIADDGSLSNRRVFADGLGPDGICMDTDGAIWTQSGGNSCVRVTEGGEILDRVTYDRPAFACMLGGPDGRTLFATATIWDPSDPFGGKNGKVFIAEAPAPHAGWP